ncbi:PAS domain-containing protein [Jeotgalibacillus sp. JSM ZJ347]|uniref:PAS domain-containing protein n=1 Tax=Jeotgalibacillus sp. JSM ZJ347 TaxID=3342117 RepID=UPI0035A8646A
MTQIKTEKLVEFIETALNYSRAGFTITDPLQLDNPIIYANKGFLDITGYVEHEVIGKNCRFLQGKDTNPDTVDQIRTAIRNQTSINVQILNYTKDQSPFWNDLHIDPITIEDQLYFVGVQKDITENIHQKEQLVKQAIEIELMSTPIVPVQKGVSVLPIIGELSHNRYVSITNNLMDYLNRSEDDYILVDLSGMIEVDTTAIEHLFQLQDLTKLTGTAMFFTGIKPTLAIKMIHMNGTFDKLRSFSNVRAALDVINQKDE